jgi:hypothetical protein
MLKGAVVMMLVVGGFVGVVCGCSGAGNPPPAPEGQTASGQSASAAQSGDPGTGAGSAAACTEEGATGRCAQILDRRGDYVLCARGTRSCSGGEWGSCAPQSGESDWYPADAPCEPCGQEGATRSCEIELSSQGEVHNCFKGTETCERGFWAQCK